MKQSMTLVATGRVDLVGRETERSVGKSDNMVPAYKVDVAIWNPEFSKLEPVDTFSVTADDRINEERIEIELGQALSSMTGVLKVGVESIGAIAAEVAKILTSEQRRLATAPVESLAATSSAVSKILS